MSQFSFAYLPRVMIAAAASGSGKTTITMGLLRCLERRMLKVNSYKCGPDYIDPMFHRSVLGTPCRNLDLFFCGEEEVCNLLADSAKKADIAVLEGVMGFYDGLGGRDTQASAYHVASTTATPVVLVVDGRGTSLTLTAVVKGLKEFRDNSQVAGVIINRCNRMSYRLLADSIEQELGLQVLGYVENDPAIGLESRHLGLITAQEVEDLQAKIDYVADKLEESVDIDALIELARDAEPLGYFPPDVEPVDAFEPPVIAVASDKAFCFYYDESLEYLKRLGAELVEFSPLLDDDLPSDTCAIYLGGGYPELYAAQLSRNISMLETIRNAYDAGMPILAECGGFLYLKEHLADQQGNLWPMAGILSGSAQYTGRLSRFGYIELTAQKSGMGFKRDTTVRAHEFHYYDSDDNGTDFHAVKPISGRSWDCGVLEDRLLAGFPHFYLPACPDLARGFVEAACEYRDERDEW